MMDSYTLAVARMNDLNRVPGDVGEYLRTEYKAGTAPDYLIAAALDEDGRAPANVPIDGFFRAVRRLFRRPRARDDRQPFWHHAHT